MKYKLCCNCRFWVEEKTKRCPNCGRFYPTKQKSTIKTYTAKGAGIAVSIGFIFSIFLLLSTKDAKNDLGATFGGMAFLTSITGAILGCIIGVVYETYLNLSKVKYLNQPYLKKDEQKIRQRQNDLALKEQKKMSFIKKN